MNSYHIIDNVPYGFELEKLTNRQLKEFEQWFYQNKEYRLNELQKEYVRFCGRTLDFSVESLKGLSEFMKREITTEPLEEEYYASLRAKIPDYIDIPTNDLSRKSRSLLFDIGIYLGEVFIRTHHKLRWEQNKYKEADRGYMVIRINDGLAPFFSPLWVIFILGGKVTDNTFVENGLLDVYNIYSGSLSENYR